jgi:RHS repeat-associated protein
MQTAEGFVSKNLNWKDGSTDKKYPYSFTVSDHLGNIRVVVDEQGQVHQKNEYTAFGVVQSTDPSKNKYLFNNKELQTGTNYLDYGARMYQPELGRWNVVDPLGEHSKQIDKSPYSAFWNNPINYNDPDGRCPNCPDETYVPIANHVYEAKVGTITSNGWEVMRVDKNDETGYQGALYRGTYNGNTEYIYATAGTDFNSAKDWKNNGQQIISGNSAQYEQSVGVARDENKAHSGVSFTGHSLGGGLASANALAIEGKAVTFNAAGLSNATKENPRLGLSGKSANISAYVVQGEAVSHYQGVIGIRAEGKITTLPASYVPQIPFTKADDVIRTGQRAYNHTMGVVTDKFNQYKKK